MKEYLPIIKARSGLFRGIEESELEKLFGCLEARKQTYRKEEYILREGEQTKVLGLVLSGSVLIVQEDVWGGRNVLSVLGPGQCFAEVFACVPGSVLNVSVEAKEDTTILFLNVGRILSICPDGCSFHAQLIQNLLIDMAQKNRKLSEKITHMAKRSTREKLLSYLSEQAVKNKSSEFEIPYNRQQLADYLGVDRSGLSVQLCRLRDEGMLTFHKNKIRLINCMLPKISALRIRSIQPLVWIVIASMQENWDFWK